MLTFENDITACLDTLEKGGLILYPTDTIWGIGCDASNFTAVEKVYALKQRPEKKAMIILLGDIGNIPGYVENPPPALQDYLSNTLKPTTVIYDHAKNLPSNLVNSDGSIAIRIVQDEFCMELLHRFGKPLVSTSANISGSAAPVSFNDLSEAIKNGVDYIVQHRRNEISSNSPSSIVRFNSEGGIIVIR